MEAPSTIIYRNEDNEARATGPAVKDQYGFAVDPKFEAEYTAFASKHDARVERMNVAWTGQNLQKLLLPSRRAKLCELVIDGLPPEHRILVWSSLSGANSRKESCNLNTEMGAYFADLVERNGKREEGSKAPEAFYEIEKDLDRTFPGHAFFDSSDGRDRLKVVLEAYARRNKAVGYCQSMNFVAGWLVLLTTDDEDAFYLLTAIVEDLCAGMWSKAMLSVQVDSMVLNDLIKEKLPEIHKKLDRLPGALLLLVTKWFMCLFAGILPSETMLRVWDFFFMNGVCVLFQAALTVMSLFQEDIVKAKDTVYMIDNLMKKCKGIFDPKVLVAGFTKYGDINNERVEELRNQHRAYFSNEISKEQLDELRANIREGTYAGASRAAEMFNQITSVHRTFTGKIDHWLQRSKANYMKYTQKREAAKLRGGINVELDGETEKRILQSLTHIGRPFDIALQGSGMRLYDSKRKYQGYFANGKRDGFGVLCELNGRVEYEGWWKNDRREGKGTYDDGQGTVYKGQWRNDEYYGKGLLKTPAGDIYDGEWKNHKKEGKGIMTFANGDKYDGFWHNGHMEGKGTMTYVNGDKYDGSWLADKREGVGTLLGADGSRYDGQWKDDKQEGRGVFVHGGNRYDGDWVKDQAHGRGTMVYANGDRYDGDWLRGKREGRGTLVFANGDSFEGVWLSGNPCGRGVVTYGNKDRYDGDCDNFRPHGGGLMVYANGDKYSGAWVDGKPEGNGVMWYANGDQYDGLWRGGKPDGRGCMTYGNGDRYEGRWVQGLRDGDGQQTYADGSCYEGDWRANRQEGTGSMVFANGDKYDGEWRDGKQEGRGVMIYARMDRYEGEWKAGRREGKGTVEYRDGDMYVGSWKRDVVHGFGVYMPACDPVGGKFEGQFERGYRIVNGVKCWPNGDPLLGADADRASRARDEQWSLDDSNSERASMEQSRARTMQLSISVSNADAATISADEEPDGDRTIARRERSRSFSAGADRPPNPREALQMLNAAGSASNVASDKGLNRVSSVPAAAGDPADSKAQRGSTPPSAASPRAGRAGSPSSLLCASGDDSPKSGGRASPTAASAASVAAPAPAFGSFPGSRNRAQSSSISRAIQDIRKNSVV